MGREKQRMEYGYSSNGDLIVCTSCFDDESLRKLIESFERIGSCSYCDNYNVKICDLNSVVQHIVESISFEWDDPANAGVGWESAEGGWLVEPVSTYELLTGELGIEIQNDKLLEDINSSILNTEWCKKSPYSLAENKRLFYGWERFSDFVKFNTRYVLLTSKKNNYDHEEMSSDEILESIGTFIQQHDLIKSINVLKKIYRVRIVNKDRSLSSAQELGSPPKEFCTFANRMSPAGISMFYGAFDACTAIKETYNTEEKVTKKAICGVFNPVRDLTVIDLSKIPLTPSLFDADNRYDRDTLAFLNDFVVDFCKPIERADRAHIDYVPTQVVTEYFRHVLFRNIGKQIDGVIYPSSKDKGKNCVVIFANSNQCGGANTLFEEQMLSLSGVKEIQLTRAINADNLLRGFLC